MSSLDLTARQARLTARLSRLSPEQRAQLLDRLRQAPAAGSPLLPPLTPRPRSDEALPLSFAQQRLWFLAQFDPEDTSYNIRRALELRGPLHVRGLEAALEMLLHRHEALRTTFSSVDGQPTQHIAAPAPWVLPLIDLRAHPPVEREVVRRQLIDQLVQRPFDLVQGPLLRTHLLRLEAELHVLVVAMHHIASDAWSMEIFARELSTLYGAFAAGRPSPLAPLAVQYADFAAWQRQWLTGEVLDNQLGYWRTQLAGLEPLALPTDRPRPPVHDPAGATVAFTVEPQVAKALTALGRGHGATPFMVLLATFQSLLARYCGQTDIAVGTPIAGRTRVEVEPLIGFFVNTLVLRTQLSGDPSFVELLARVRETALDAYAHQDVPFERLVDELQPQRDPSRNPLFQVMFVLQNTTPAHFHLAGLDAQPLPIDWQTAKFDLTLQLEEQLDSALAGKFEFATALFDPSTAERMTEHYLQLLTSIAANPSARLSRLEMLTQAERHQLLLSWNATRTEYPRQSHVVLQFEAQAARRPNAIAVTEGMTLTYGELNRRANRIAHALMARGVRRGTAVGLCVERSTELAVGTLGILKAGGVYVPLDPGYPQQRLAFMMEDARASVVVTPERLKGALPESVAAELHLEEALSGWPDTHPEVELEASDLAYIIYTSGSTGRPKGVGIPHQAILRLVLNTNYIQLTEQDCIAQLSNTSFDAVTFELWGALLTGGQLVGVPKEVVLSPRLLAKHLREHQVSTLFATAALFNQIVAERPDAFQTVAHVLVGGEALDVHSVRTVLERGAPKRLLNGYGPTESTTFAVFHEVREVPEGTATVPIGRPLANTEAYVLDGQLEPVPVGVIGELCLGGEGLGWGYMNRPELTAEKFVPHPFSELPGARLYRTGDRARLLPDGTIDCLGRLDHQVKLRGFRIELSEIEAGLARHAGVRAAVATVRELRPGDKRLIGYVVPHGSPPSPAELRAFLGAHLPEYMLPSLWVTLDSLPLMQNGKVDRKALPLPEGARSELQGEYVAPRTHAEQRIAAIWCDVLGVDRVGAHDNFFALGGHSLLATRVAVRLRQAFDIDIPLLSLFEATTVAALASVVEAMIEEEIAQLSDDEVEALLAGEGKG